MYELVIAGDFVDRALQGKHWNDLADGDSSADVDIGMIWQMGTPSVDVDTGMFWRMGTRQQMSTLE